VVLLISDFLVSPHKFCQFFLSQIGLNERKF
jgi:hypothetical protein